LKHLRVQGVGDIKIKLHRPVSGKIKTVSVKRAGNHWYACFSCQVSEQPWPENTNQIGIDVGQESFATLSTGEIVDNPRHLAQAEKRLRRTQRRVTGRKKYSQRWRKAVQLVQNVHTISGTNGATFSISCRGKSSPPINSLRSKICK
jgi:putative transposase